ncbi:MAG: DUF3226 domain-containing protein [Leptolyngbyaceae bacterium]|nr:DUF3226 domain-containing protein [Leptolyngbyaceae bacterium]
MMRITDRVLLVEGRDDREVIYQFCNYYGIDNQSLFSVETGGGFDSLLKELGIRVRTEVKVLGIVVDADASFNSRWEEIGSALKIHGYALPTLAIRGGTIIEPPNASRPLIGIWLMPDNQEPGMIEDFLLRLTEEENSLIARAENAVDSIPETEQLFGKTKRSKAIIHTWLAWQEEPGTPLGLAIRRHYLDPTRDPAPLFKTWLETLFMPTT